MLQLLLLLLPLLWEGSLSQILELQPSVTVQAGMCAHVLCTFHRSGGLFSYHYGVHGYWFREGTHVLYGRPVATNDPSREVEDEAEGRFHLLGDPRMNNCSLSITDARFSDTGKYFFRFHSGYDKYSYLKNLLYVNVTDLIQKPDISIPEMVESGHPVTLNCTFLWTCGENRPFKFSWRGTALSSKTQSSWASHSSEVSFIPGHQHHGTNLTCQVTLPGGRLSTERTVQLNVSYAVQNVAITTAQDSRTTEIQLSWTLAKCGIENSCQPCGEEGELWIAADQDWAWGRRQAPWPAAFSAQENSSWPLMLTLLRGALMGAGFLLTYGLTWLYYTRNPLGREQPPAPEAAQCSMLLLLLLLLPLLWEGSLSQTLQGQLSVTLQEEMCAHVLCTFNDNARLRDDRNSVYGYWFRKGIPPTHDKIVATNDPDERVKGQDKGRFHLLGDPKMNNCSLSITEAQSSDTGKYFFSLHNGYYKYMKKLLYVNVTDLIQKPDISIPEIVESGHPVTLNCTFLWTCGENRPFKFSWRGTALFSKTQSSWASHSSEVSFIPGHQHHGTNLTCQVTLPGGRLSTERTVQLNVSYAVQNMTITTAQDSRTTVFISGNSSDLVVQEGQSLRLLCAANSNPPATLSWLLGDQTLASSQPSQNGVLHLDLPHLGPADGGNYICLAQHPLGSKQASLNVSVQYRPTPSHVFQNGVILGALCGAITASLLALCLLLLFTLLYFS
uniref:Sialic acid-binding Ig-like lectin 14 n=1 Tax=Phascolarctos cinereus TaxID=38626 RepID=A0A6P5LMC1_PHACI|nr:sialic acid-binding Ig-like lectin 14 [Phascolarctos cinereus]